MPPHHYSTHPLLPPSSADPGSQYLDDTLYTRAPRMPCVPLPPCLNHYHPQPSLPHCMSHLPLYAASKHLSQSTPMDGLMTPPPSPPRIHPVLSSALTVVRYDFACDPQTIRMSSSSQYPFFPSNDPASSPSAFVLHVRCEVTGHTITVHTCNGAVTCHDLMAQLHHFFEGEMGREEWRDVKGARRSVMKKAYEERTGFAYSVSACMKRVDHLLGRTTFKRIVPEYDGDSMWLLQTC